MLAKRNAPLAQDSILCVCPESLVRTKRPDFGLCFTYPAHVLCVAGRVKHPPLQGHSPGESPRQSGLVPRHGARAPEASGPVPLRAKARDSAALRR